MLATPITWSASSNPRLDARWPWSNTKWMKVASPTWDLTVTSSDAWALPPASLASRMTVPGVAPAWSRTPRCPMIVVPVSENATTPGRGGPAIASVSPAPSWSCTFLLPLTGTITHGGETEPSNPIRFSGWKASPWMNAAAIRLHALSSPLTASGRGTTRRPEPMPA